jgi:hypothetical protein
VCENSPYGPLAQLVERFICNEDVSGSNPLGSTFVHESSERGFSPFISLPVGGSNIPGTLRYSEPRFVVKMKYNFFMNIETIGNGYKPEKRELDETEPSLPADPTEAAAWLQEVWKGSGGWKSQHPLRLKVKEPTDYQEMSEEEKEQFHKLGNQYKWLAEMHRSEMGWSQSYARNNSGEVIGFRFGYDGTPENPEDNVPEAYIFLPFDEKQPKVYLSQGNDGWKVEPVEEVAAKYAKNFGY